MDDRYEVGEAAALRETDRAIFVKIDGVGSSWIPKSQIHDDSEVWKKGDRGTLVVTEWFADKQGWL